MENVGIELTFKNGEKQSFDPVELPNGFLQNEDGIFINVFNYDYHYDADQVESIREYKLCVCGYELYDDGCHNYGCKKCSE